MEHSVQLELGKSYSFDTLPTDQIVLMEFYPDQKVQMKLDFRYHNVIVPQKIIGNIDNFFCEDSYFCKKDYKTAKIKNYQDISIAGNEIYTLLKFSNTQLPSQTSLEQNLKMFLADEDSSQKLNYIGILGLLDLEIFLEEMYKIYGNGLRTFSLEYYASYSGSDYKKKYISDLEFRLSVPRRTDVEVFSDKGEKSISFIFGLLTDFYNASFIFDNKKNYLMGVQNAHKITSTINEKICGNPKMCNKLTDKIDLENAPKLLLFGNSKREIYLGVEKYSYFDENSILRYYIEYSDQNILGSMFFSNITNISYLAFYLDNPKILIFKKKLNMFRNRIWKKH